MQLTEIPGIAGATAKKLKQQGIPDAETLADADPAEVEVPTGNASTLVSRASQATITSESAGDLLARFEEKDYYPTGVMGLDDAMDGGFEAGTIALVYGKSDTGKSQLAFSGMAEGAVDELNVVYLGTEMQSDSISDRLYRMAGENKQALANISMYEAYSVGEQYETYESIEQDFDDIDLFIIDSFTAQFRVTDDFAGRENLGDRSEVMGKHLRKIGQMTRSYECATVMTGQVYGSPDAYSRQDTPWGGEKMKHFVSYYVRMSEGQGNLKQATLENHPGRPETEVDLTITNTGLDDVSQ